MRKSVICLISLVIAAVTVSTQEAPKAEHSFVTPSGIKWGDPPPIFRKGASFTVVSGDPGKPGLFVVRLKMPAGYKVAPHWHPADEHVTVLSGTFALGMGETFRSMGRDRSPSRT